MTKATLIGTFLLAALFANGQEKLALTAGIGHAHLFGDITANEQQNNRLNAAAFADLQYDLNKYLSVRARLRTGMMDGQEFGLYYETTFIEPALYLDFNILPLFGKESKYRAVIGAGAGWGLLYSKLTNTLTDAVKSVPSNNKAFSNSPSLNITGMVSVPIVRKVDLRAGYDLGMQVGNDYYDGHKSGNSNDFTGFAWVGLSFSLRDELKKGEMKVQKSRYDELNNQVAEAKEQAQMEKAKADMRVKEKDLQIAALRNELDSLRANAAKVAEAPAPEEGVRAEDALKEESWRIIIGSYPSRALAQQFIDRTSLDKSGMFIAHIESLNTYRVVYKSYPSQNAAQKDLPEARSVVADAWIVKF